MTTDVVVVGYGPAGAAAAIAAHDAGSRVVVVEATAKGGGNSLYSGGFLFDLPDDVILDHLEALSFGRTARSVLEAYAAGLHGVDGWLASLGATTVPFEPPPMRLPASFPSWPNFSSGPHVRYRVVGGGAGRRGAALWEVLDAAVRSRGIEVHFSTPARELLLDGDRVTGVLIADGGAEAAIHGTVVLASGGFECDPALVDSFLPLGPAWPVGHPGNTGHGLRMAQQAGADLWHMYGFFGWFAYRAAEFDSPFAIDFFGPGHIFVDADGHRYSDETGYEVHDRLRALLNYLPRNPNRPRLPSWAVFDESARLAGPLNGLLGSPNEYVWSHDNAAEIDRGWIVPADGVEELATRIGVETDVLAATIAEYNAYAAAGRDDRFSRSADTLTPLDTSRLYAIETWPGIAGTTGGPRHDARARVLRPDGSPIDGLHAAGAVSMVWGHLIDHGGGLTDAIVFGRIAGADAADSKVE